MNITVLIIIYVVGIILNALAAASIWDDLKDDGRLVNVRMAVVMFFVIASFGTWVYMIAYLLAKVIKGVFKPKKTDGGENDD